MNSEVTADFVRCFQRLPARVQRTARKNYKLWQKDPSHPGLEFKLVGKRMPIYSVRVGIGWRALGILSKDTVTWFWIGSHAGYDKLLGNQYEGSRLGSQLLSGGLDRPHFDLQVLAVLDSLDPPVA